MKPSKNNKQRATMFTAGGVPASFLHTAVPHVDDNRDLVPCIGLNNVSDRHVRVVRALELNRDMARAVAQSEPPAFALALSYASTFVRQCEVLDAARKCGIKTADLDAAIKQLAIQRKVRSWLGTEVVAYEWRNKPWYTRTVYSIRENNRLMLVVYNTAGTASILFHNTRWPVLGYERNVPALILPHTFNPSIVLAQFSDSLQACCSAAIHERSTPLSHMWTVIPYHEHGRQKITFCDHKRDLTYVYEISPNTVLLVETVNRKNMKVYDVA